jgi:integrase
MVRRPIAHRTLAKLTSADIATYRDERLKDVAPATVVRELNTLSHAIETALREWGLWLPRNPVKMVRRPNVPQGRKRRLEDGEEERLLAACDRGRTPASPKNASAMLLEANNLSRRAIFGPGVV